MVKPALPPRFVLCTCLILSSCVHGPEYIEGDPKTAPTCAELRAAFRASLDDFDSVRSGLEISKSGSVYSTYDTSLKMRGASSCVIRKSGVRNELYCRWEAGDSRPLMGAYYRAIRDQVKSCIRKGSVSQNDRGGYTHVTLYSEQGYVSFWVMARFESPPYYVNLTVEK
jgi:hypothetical protein